MDNRPIENPEDMPTLYRVILDRVAELERTDRPTGERFRRAAIRAYSTSWDRTNYGRLEILADQLTRRLDRQQRAERKIATAQAASTPRASRAGIGLLPIRILHWRS